MARKRTSMGKKLRFEVFKRDSFKCQYCGRSAPEVTLEVDHIIPVVEGGKNEMLNLITSCRDCNRGKGKMPLSDDLVVTKEKAQLDELNERRVQLEMMLQWKKELARQLDDQVDLIVEVIEDGYWTASQEARKRIKKIIKEFSFMEVYEAAEIAQLQYHEFTRRMLSLGGICYNRRRGVMNGYQENH